MLPVLNIIFCIFPGESSQPGDLPNPGIELRSLTLQADSLLSEPPGKPWVTARFFLSIDDTLHPEWLLQPLCTILHFGPMPQKLTTPL